VSNDHPTWAVSDGVYSVSYNTVTTDKLEPGLYDINSSQGTLYFSQVDLREDQLLVFPDSVQENILDDITKFWASEELFKKHDIPFKRGVLLFGQPGSGKSSLLRLVSRDVISRGGVVFQFTNPDMFVAGYRQFREVQSDTPIVVIMEDLDTIFSHNNESKILNLLDGAESAEGTVFLATTNFPEKMGPRIMNRPSRFDRVYRVPPPSAKAREMYLDELAGAPGVIPSERWAQLTQGLSLSHLKELFIGVHILGGDEEETIATLKGMRVKHTSAEDDYIEGEVDDYAGGTYV
jgi:energy-coupling factor transporter ATP-binding protein EcfA2